MRVFNLVHFPMYEDPYITCDSQKLISGRVDKLKDDLHGLSQSFAWVQCVITVDKAKLTINLTTNYDEWPFLFFDSFTKFAEFLFLCFQFLKILQYKKLINKNGAHPHLFI